MQNLHRRAVDINTKLPVPFLTLTDLSLVVQERNGREDVA